MRHATNYNDAAAVIALFRHAAEAMRGAERRENSIVRLPARGRLIATGDLHDNPFHLEKIIRLARLDESPDHYVVMHELIHGERLLNGMDFSYRMLSRVAELIVDRPEQVHSVLANHELAQMTGRGVSKGAGNSVELFLMALDYVFGERALDVAEAINGFIAAMPIALISESPDDAGGVLCAHSLPMAAMMPHFDTDLFHRDLREEDYRAPHGSAYLMVWGRQYTVEQTEELAQRWGVKLFCLGHEHAETGIEMRGPRVIILNTDHERATVLPIDLGAVPTVEESFTYAVPLSALG
ncbi:MAG: metallophosphoesterase [Planctomycetota bacterium]|nr:metallophosphoesterase [Planctomycetota bacterium]